MAFLTNPNLARLLVVVGVTLLLLTSINPRSIPLKVGMALCLIAAGLEFFYLKVNPWAFLVVAISPLPFFIAVHQARAQNPLFLISILMFIMGSVFLFVDPNGRPVDLGLAGFVYVLCASVLWIATEGLRNAEGGRLHNDPDSVVGMIGETQTDIEPHSAGSVWVEGELWQARSKKPIPAGSTVRVLRQDGFWLTVKQVENVIKTKDAE
jgi:membrane-bound serine protease (ClpP class)